jgi:hypothetical protein
MKGATHVWRPIKNIDGTFSAVNTASKSPLARVYLRPDNLSLHPTVKTQGQWEWIGKPGKNGLRNIHDSVVSSIIELHAATVIGSGFVKTNNKGERFIEIITEINMSNGHKVRCHPDFPNSGEWYDWFLVKWRLPRSSDEIRGCESSPLLWSHHKDESDKYTKRGIDLFNFEDQTYRTDRWGRTVDFRELLTNLEHHLPQEEMADDDFDKPSSDIDIYVPAKVVAIIKCKTTASELGDPIILGWGSRRYFLNV